MPIQIIRSSMNPTYQNGALNFVNRWSYAKGAPHRGDVIALKMDDEMLLKRIIALPGETITSRKGKFRLIIIPCGTHFQRDESPGKWMRYFWEPMSTS